MTAEARKKETMPPDTILLTFLARKQKKIDKRNKKTRSKFKGKLNFGPHMYFKY